MNAAIDTDVLLRWILGDVPEQLMAADALLAKKRTYHVADVALQEIVYVMERVAHLPRTVIADALQMIVAQANINCNRTLILKVLPLYLKHKTASFTDICLAVYAELGNCTPVYTFDKKMARDLPQVELVR